MTQNDPLDRSALNGQKFGLRFPAHPDGAQTARDPRNEKRDVCLPSEGLEAGTELINDIIPAISAFETGLPASTVMVDTEDPWTVIDQLPSESPFQPKSLIIQGFIILLCPRKVYTYHTYLR